MRENTHKHLSIFIQASRYFRLLVGLLLLIVIAPGVIPALSTPAQALSPSQQRADRAYQEGMKLLRQKRYQEALDQFRKVEQQTPRLPQGYTGEGIALALTGKLQPAVEALQKALEVDPSYWVARRELGIVNWQLNKKDEAAKDLTNVAKLFPNDASVNLILGQYEFDNKNYAQASEYFSKAPVEVAASPRLSIMAAQAFIKTGQLKPAAAQLEVLSVTPGLSPRQQFQIAWLLGEAKDYSRAIQLFKSLPASFSDPFGRDYGLALAYYENGQAAECIAVLSDLKARGIVRPDLFSLLGAAEEKHGNTLQAYKAFRQGIYQFPHDDKNYLNIATLAVEHFNYQVATQVLTSGLQQIPNDYKLFLTRGVVHTLQKKLFQAQADYEKALALDPGKSSGYVALGICFMDRDNYAQAIKILREGLQRGLKNVLLDYFLADALFREGITASSPSYEEALASVQSSLKRDPEFAYAYLQRGRLELISNQVNAAVTDLEHARTLAPHSRAVLYQLAIADRRDGRTAEAERLFSEVAAASKEEAAAFRKGKLIEIMVAVSNKGQSVP